MKFVILITMLLIISACQTTPASTKCKTKVVGTDYPVHFDRVCK